MNKMRPVHSILYSLMLVSLLVATLLLSFPENILAETETVIVTAEGLADPDGDAFKNDSVALENALLKDARKQAVEKVIGLYMDNPLLLENYSSIDREVLAQDLGLVKEILQKSEPWPGGDGFMHILIKAEVYAGKVENALREMGRSKRIKLIREAGNPRISVAITVRDSNRDSSTEPERSSVAENILKEHISGFGYRVWSEKKVQQSVQPGSNTSQTSDFAIRGEVKFKPVNLKLKTSGIEINKITITSWTVKCVDNVTGEEIYFNNQIPERRSWNTEDAALAAIGEQIGKEFSKEFFEQHLLQRTKIYQLEVDGLPSYDTAILFKKELIGLRPVLNVDLRTFDKAAKAHFEVEFSANEDDFSEILNNSILKPLNMKFGGQPFSLSSVNKQLITVLFRSSDQPEKVNARFKENPPSSLATASPVRLDQIAATRGSLEKIAKINPQGVEEVMELRKSGGKRSLEAIKNF